MPELPGGQDAGDAAGVTGQDAVEAVMQAQGAKVGIRGQGNQTDSQGTADADVQAEEDQAKEGAWELFTG